MPSRLRDALSWLLPDEELPPEDEERRPESHEYVVNLDEDGEGQGPSLEPVWPDEEMDEAAEELSDASLERSLEELEELIEGGRLKAVEEELELVYDAKLALAWKKVKDLDELVELLREQAALRVEVHVGTSVLKSITPEMVEVSPLVGYGHYVLIMAVGASLDLEELWKTVSKELSWNVLEEYSADLPKVAVCKSRACVLFFQPVGPRHGVGRQEEAFYRPELLNIPLLYLDRMKRNDSGWKRFLHVLEVTSTRVDAIRITTGGTGPLVFYLLIERLLPPYRRSDYTEVWVLERPLSERDDKVNFSVGLKLSIPALSERYKGIKLVLHTADDYTPARVAVASIGDAALVKGILGAFDPADARERLLEVRTNIINDYVRGAFMFLEGISVMSKRAFRREASGQGGAEIEAAVREAAVKALSWAFPAEEHGRDLMGLQGACLVTFYLPYSIRSFMTDVARASVRKAVRAALADLVAEAPVVSFVYLPSESEILPEEARGLLKHNVLVKVDIQFEGFRLIHRGLLDRGRPELRRKVTYLRMPESQEGLPRVKRPEHVEITSERFVKDYHLRRLIRTARQFALKMGLFEDHSDVYELVWRTIYGRGPRSSDQAEAVEAPAASEQPSSTSEVAENEVDTCYEV